MFFCKHEWEVLSETTTKSKFEVTISSLKEAGLVGQKIPWQLCNVSRKFIQIVACKKCGKLERFVTDI